MSTKTSILIVDDDATLRKTLSDILKAKRYVTTAVARGEEALEKTKQEPPTVALIDLKLEGMSGLELMKRIKAEHPETECILLTGYASQASAIEAVNLGAYSYVQKPYDMEQLLVTIRRAVEKRQAEEALILSNENFQQVVSNIATVVWKADIRNNGAFENTYTSPVVDELLELPAGTMKNDWNKFFSYIKPEYLERVNNAFREAIISPGKKIDCEYEVLKDNGQTAWFHSKGRCFGKKGKLHVFGSTIDITERKQAEEALKESEEKYRALLTNINDLVMEIDSEGKFTYVSPQIFDMFGYTQEESIGLTAMDFVHPDDIEKCMKAMETLDEVKQIEYRSRHKDGHYVYVSTSGRCIPDGVGGFKIVSVLRDITERKQAEEALSESEERYRTLIGTSHEMIQSVKPDGHFDFVNKAWHDILGYTKKELSKLSLFDIVHPESLDHCKKMFEKVLAGESVKNAEAKFMAKDGSTVFVEGDITGRYIDGKLVTTYGFFRDVTTRKRAEEELEQSFEKLQRAFEGTVSALASAVEIRDPYTAGHQRRVTELACAIAKEAGLSEGQIEGLCMAGLIHDAGKINVPAEILSKPTRLTDIEFDLIKIHPRAGYDILKGIEFPWPVAQIVLQHHERIDGSGYPTGLKGDEILLEARILGVADVVEAMSSHRPYRPARGIDKALEEIAQNKGKLYDPRIVDACLKVFTEGRFKFEG